MGRATAAAGTAPARCCTGAGPRVRDTFDSSSSSVAVYSPLARDMEIASHRNRVRRTLSQEGTAAMLVLARQRDQSVMIARQIEVKVVDIRGDKVRLGFVARKTSRSTARKFLRREPRAKRINRRAKFLQRSEPPWIHFFAPPSMKPDRASRKAACRSDRCSVRDGEIIGRGHNRRVQHGDPMAHAEIDCLTQAGRQTTYDDTVLYSTLMPCYLCTGAVGPVRRPEGDRRRIGHLPRRRRQVGQIPRLHAPTASK